MEPTEDVTSFIVDVIKNDFIFLFISLMDLEMPEMSPSILIFTFNSFMFYKIEQKKHI